MKFSEAANILEATVLCHEDLMETEVISACGSDLMSDVMAFVKDQVLLLTGLINIQVIRTASLMDIGIICFVRGKHPSQAMIELAKEENIVLLATKQTLYVASGKLYKAGLIGSGAREIQ